MVAEVIVNIGGDDILDYKIANGMQADLVGKRVIVPLGKKEVLGLVARIKDKSVFKKLKEIITVLDKEPVLSEELLELHSYISDYYLTPLMRVVNLSFPESIKVKKRIDIKIIGDKNQRILLSENEENFLKGIEENKISFSMIKNNKNYLKIFTNMQENNFVELNEVFFLPEVKSKEFLISFNPKIEVNLRPNGKPERLYSYLKKRKNISLDELKQTDFYDSTALQSLLKKEALLKTEVDNKKNANFFSDTIVLTSEQKEAVSRIKSDKRPSLLFGVTGSGKTEVYIELMKDLLKQKKSVLYMVPEISLIDQTRRRIKEKFPQEIILWHSNMTQKEKIISWEKLQKDKAYIILGARSSIFAPVKNLGLIVVDEEHETSYKQNEPDPRYNAVEVALKRGELSGAKLVLGSATPSLERYYRGTKEELQIVTLKNRPVNSKLPTVEIIDLKEEFKMGNRSVFSSALENRIRQTLEKKEQIILFLNRRGFSRFILCRECGHVVTCSKCSVPLILHKFPDILKCHYCEKVSAIPTKCPECSSKFIKDMGMGTQKIESLLLESFPGVRVTRLDQDQIKNKDSYKELLSEFSEGRSDILLGTQMVVKGLDFSRVTLVGIISADLSLNVPDLYSAERTFQLLTQVAGRAGRGDLPGHVVIQTYNPEHFSIVCSQKHNFESFFKQELKQRKLMDYPPYTKLVRILVTGENQQKTQEYIEKVVLKIKKILTNEEILGPGEAPISKIKNRYRYHAIIKTKDNFLHNYLKENYNVFKREGEKKDMRVLFDVDPFLIL